jgi:hypothetical protein
MDDERCDDDIETGEPLAELASLREEPDDGFLPRIRRSIDRRLLVSDTADFSFRMLLKTMFDYLTAALDALQSGRDDERSDDDER